jgi:hypothetical protein
MGSEVRQPGGIRFVDLLPRALAHCVRMSADDLQRFHQHVVDRLPVYPRALQYHDWAALLVEPGPQGQELVVCGAKVPPLRTELPDVMHPAQTRRPRRRRAIPPTTHGGTTGMTLTS